MLDIFEEIRKLNQIISIGSGNPIWHGKSQRKKKKNMLKISKLKHKKWKR